MLHSNLLVICFVISTIVAFPANHDPMENIGNEFREGDIKIPRQKQTKGFFQNDISELWTNNNVPFYFDPDFPFSVSEKQTILNAMNIIDRQTSVNNGADKCITFTDIVSNENFNSNYIKIGKQSGCWSYVGMIGTPTNGYLAQELSIGSGCDYEMTVAHELLHALGYNHEHTRTDRDDYIIIDFTNIQNNREANFQIKNGDTLQMPYDYYSIMHYSSTAFAKDYSKPVIVAKDPSVVFKHTSDKEKLTQIDVEEIRKAYGCISNLCDSHICHNGGICSEENRSDRNLDAIAVCICPHGTTGIYCENVENVCTSIDLSLSKVTDFANQQGDVALDLSNKCISLIEKKAFKNLGETLIELNLSSNNISMINKKNFYNLGSLETLNLDNNKLEIIKRNTFLHLTNLKSLTIRNNKLSKIARRAFLGLGNLEMLDLSFNNLIKIQVNYLTNLNTLNMNNNEIAVIKNNVLSKTQVTELYLNNNLLTDNGIKRKAFVVQGEKVCFDVIELFNNSEDLQTIMDDNTC